MDQRPIGVFDSGSGGLTAVREIRSILPFENIIYFGDTSRVPYGGRSAEILLRYARQDVHFLRSFDVKALLVACGTVSTVGGSFYSSMSTVMLSVPCCSNSPKYVSIRAMISS